MLCCTGFKSDIGFSESSIAGGGWTLNVDVSGWLVGWTSVEVVLEVAYPHHIWDLLGVVLVCCNIDHWRLEAERWFRTGCDPVHAEDWDQLAGEDGDHQEDSDDSCNAATGAGHLHLVVESEEVGEGEEHSYLLR